MSNDQSPWAIVPEGCTLLDSQQHEVLLADAKRFQFLVDNPFFQIEYTGALSLRAHIDLAMKERE